MIYSVRKLFYVFKCDCCGKVAEVECDGKRVYNGAQAVRSLGWSFGRDKKIKCPICKKYF